MTTKKPSPTTAVIQAWDTQDIIRNRKAIERIIVNALQKKEGNKMIKIKRICKESLYLCECRLKQIKKWYLGIVILKTLDGLFNLKNVEVKRGDDLPMRRSNWHKMKRFVDEQCSKLDKEFNEKTGLNLPGAK